MLNIRMRASRSGKSRDAGEVHISGAEGIYEDSEMQKVVEQYVRRAMSHSKGEPDTIVVTIEKVSLKPRTVCALPVTTVECRTPSESERIIARILSEVGISPAAVRSARNVLAGGTMRGASLVSALSGRRVEEDRERGIRASRVGITKEAERKLSRRLAKEDIDTLTVREALVLASKVASCPSVRAEVCISDDPDYTTGYVASRKYGYLRIPNIKRKGSRIGGRVFFVAEGSDPGRIGEFLEILPVMISEAGKVGGTLSVDEIIDLNM